MPDPFRTSRTLTMALQLLLLALLSSQLVVADDRVGWINDELLLFGTGDGDSDGDIDIDGDRDGEGDGDREGQQSGDPPGTSTENNDGTPGDRTCRIIESTPSRTERFSYLSLVYLKSASRNIYIFRRG